MITVQPLHAILIHQTQVPLVNKIRRLQRVALFLSQVPMGHPAQFFVDKRQQLVIIVSVFSQAKWMIQKLSFFPN